MSDHTLKFLRLQTHNMGPKTRSKSKSEWSFHQKSGIFCHSSDSAVLNTSASTDDISIPHVLDQTYRSPLHVCNRTILNSKLSEHELNSCVFMPAAVMQSLRTGFGGYVTVTGSGFHLILRAFPHIIPDCNSVACTPESWLQCLHTNNSSLTIERFSETISVAKIIYVKTSEPDTVNQSKDLHRQITSFLGGKVLYNGIIIPYRFFGKRLNLSISNEESIVSLFNDMHDLSISSRVTSTPNKLKVERSEYFIISPSTRIEIDQDSSKKDEEEFIKVGGLGKQEKLLLDSVRSMFSDAPRRSVNGILLYGPPGVGKTLLALSIKTKITTAHFRLLAGPELYSKFYGETESKLREIFSEAERLAPSILVIDELDCLAPRKDNEGGEQEKRVATTLQTCLDRLYLQKTR